MTMYIPDAPTPKDVARVLGAMTYDDTRDFAKVLADVVKEDEASGEEIFAMMENLRFARESIMESEEESGPVSASQ